MPGDDEPPDDDEELTLFEVPPSARNTDPYNSHLAALSQTPEKVAPIRAAVLVSLYDAGPMTDGELWDYMGGTESSPRKRRGELTAQGLVEQCGNKISEFGTPTAIHRLTADTFLAVKANYDTLLALADKRARVGKRGWGPV